MYFFFFNDTATTEIYTLSLHDALPISNLVMFLLMAFVFGFGMAATVMIGQAFGRRDVDEARRVIGTDRKSTRLNSSHANISYAVFCLKKKKDITKNALTDSIT